MEHKYKQHNFVSPLAQQHLRHKRVAEVGVRGEEPCEEKLVEGEPEEPGTSWHIVYRCTAMSPL